MTSQLRLGIVPYLNVLPLLEGLDETFPQRLWRRATPRELGVLLERREVDLAIVSTFEGLRCGYRIVPGAMIGSDGPVRSVALCSKVPIADIRTVLLDRASLSSSALLRVLCREHLAIAPEFDLSERPLVPDFDWRADRHDALLVIGDTALAWEHAFPYRVDLGAAWKELTGLPFVFAAWWARPEVVLSPEEEAAFDRARRRGAESTEQILSRLSLAEIAAAGGREGLRHYLTRAIEYDLDERGLRSLELFREKLTRAGLLA